MKSFDLSISMEYVPSWGLSEAIRELFQNALDEEKRNTSNTMHWSYKNDTLTISNKLSKLDTKTLLFGSSDKRSNNELIGKHGEGYKLAMLVLLRLGCTFYIVQENVLWQGRVKKSRKFGMDIPSVNIIDITPSQRKSFLGDAAFGVVIGNINTEQLQKVIADNLNMQEGVCTIDSSNGRLLTDTKFKGMVFVSGLYVMKHKDLYYGYDFNADVIPLDRDRKVISDWNLLWNTSKLLSYTNDMNVMKTGMDKLDGRYMANYANDNFKNSVADSFYKKYGDKAQPIMTQEEADEITARGYKPVIVSEVYRDTIRYSGRYRHMDTINSSLYVDFKALLGRLIEGTLIDKELSEEIDSIGFKVLETLK